MVEAAETFSKGRDDAYEAALAEAGIAAPLVNGVYYVVWGVVVGAAALVTYLAVIGVLPFPQNGINLMWAGAMGLGWALSAWLGPRTGAKPGAGSVGNRITGAVWFGCGVSATVMWGAVLAAWLVGLDAPLSGMSGMIFPAAFALYAVAFNATAVAAGLRWMRFVGIGAWATTAALIFLVGEAEQLLAAALGMAVLVVAPGVGLMRAEPSDIV